MTRPNYIRADTIDLQDPDAPSAKDHSRQPTRPAALGDGPPAPHQADALKHVELEINEQHGRSPRASQDLSGKELQMLHDEADAHGYHDPNENLLRNSAPHSAQDNADDEDGDDGLDDDMTDKISSSPSIGDDGGLPVPYLPWPSRVASLRADATPEKKATDPLGPPIDVSSSPFAETPEHFPLAFSHQHQQDTQSKDHHQEGKFLTATRTSLWEDDYESESRDQLGPLISEQRSSDTLNEYIDATDSFEDSLDPNDFAHLLVPENDPLLDNNFDDEGLEIDESREPSDTSSPPSKASWDPEDSEEPDNDDDDPEDIPYDDNSRFVDSGWGGECLQETEDIDFEFVYALHTFVATVEGQANATKGDTMVLLDDSNSYWWLVRVVKDSSIGYLPAEHIETPLERLARLNKHRNLDLSQTMLGDQDEEKRHGLNPLKKAIRRRNVKKVEFAGNSYVEPSDVEYSSDEEDEDSVEYGGQEQNGTGEERQDQAREDDEPATIAPLNTREKIINGRQPDDIAAETGPRNGADAGNGLETIRSNDETLDRTDDNTTKSRKGTVRNTDSFFKDDSVETRKISLTPNILRDDSNGVSPRASESSELKHRLSLDSIEKEAPPERPKDDKKKKEKKGMLGGMFRRKDKKSKGQDRDADDNEKTSSDLARKSPTPKESVESLSQDTKSSPQPHRQTSKLQKQPPAKLSPKSSYNAQSQAQSQIQNQTQRSALAEQHAVVGPEQDRGPAPALGQHGSMRLVSPESRPMYDDMQSRGQTVAPDITREPPREAPIASQPPMQAESPKEKSGAIFSPSVNVMRPSHSEPKSEKAKQATERMRMDDFDSSSVSSAEEDTGLSSTRESNDDLERTRQSSSDSHLAIAQAAQHESHPPASHVPPTADAPRLFQSPIQVPSPTSTLPLGRERSTPHQPPPLITDTSSQSSSSPSPSPISPISSSPSLLEAPTNTRIAPTTTPLVMTNAQVSHQSQQTNESTSSASPSTRTTNTATTTRSTPTWSDASLRAYMDDDSEIRDLLLVVNDKTGVVPRKDHPVVKGLFKEENEKLGEIERRLDGLLGEFLGRRGGVKGR